MAFVGEGGKRPNLDDRGENAFIAPEEGEGGEIEAPAYCCTYCDTRRRRQWCCAQGRGAHQRSEVMHQRYVGVLYLAVECSAVVGHPDILLCLASRAY